MSAAADMLTETGRVVAVESDGVWVETIRQSTCGSCAARSGCGHGLINRVTDRQHGYIRVLPGAASPADCEVDDQVRIAIPGDVVLRGSLVVYLLPLVALLAGAVAGGVLMPGAGEGAVISGSVVGLVLGLCLVRWHAWRHREDRRMQPTLQAVLRPSSKPHTQAPRSL